MYGALYGACMVHVWCISTILYGANRLQCTAVMVMVTVGGGGGVQKFVVAFKIAEKFVL